MADEIGIIDAGLGNPRSILRMLTHLGHSARLLTSPVDVAGMQRLILPGIGHFGSASSILQAQGWFGPIREAVAEGRPLLGICLGMQLLGSGSEEAPGDSGLGFLPWRCAALPRGVETRVPHMGWNEIRTTAPSRLHSSDEGERFYFVHSYYVPADAAGVTAVADYGIPVGATVESGNVFGVQFHPEKSHRFGMHLLERFCSVLP